MSDSQNLFDSCPVDEDNLISDLLNEELSEQTDGSLRKENTEPLDNESKENAAEKSAKLTKFPLSRIKTIMKMDPDLGIVSQEAVFLVTRATELFLQNLAKETYSYTEKAKRKTVQKRDVDAAVENIDSLCFLEGALD